MWPITVLRGERDASGKVIDFPHYLQTVRRVNAITDFVAPILLRDLALGKGMLRFIESGMQSVTSTQPTVRPFHNNTIAVRRVEAVIHSTQTLNLVALVTLIVDYEFPSPAQQLYLSATRHTDK